MFPTYLRTSCDDENEATFEDLGWPGHCTLVSARLVAKIILLHFTIKWFEHIVVEYSCINTKHELPYRRHVSRWWNQILCIGCWGDWRPKRSKLFQDTLTVQQEGCARRAREHLQWWSLSRQLSEWDNIREEHRYAVEGLWFYAQSKLQPFSYLSKERCISRKIVCIEKRERGV